MPAMQPAMPGGYPQAYPGYPGGMAMQPGGMPGYPGGMPMQPGQAPQVPQQRRPAANPAGRAALADASRDPLPPPPPANGPAPAPRVLRGVRGEDRPAAPAPAPQVAVRASVAIPTPEELGIGAARPAAATRQVASNLDWSTARAQMQQLGVVRFQLENTTSGGSRFSCWVGDGAAARLVQADGASEAEAVNACLDRARQHTANRR